MRKCCRCHETKAETEFHRSTRNKSGLQGFCKACLAVAQKSNNQTAKRKAYMAAYMRAYWRAKPEYRIYSRELQRKKHATPEFREKAALKGKARRARCRFTKVCDSPVNIR